MQLLPLFILSALPAIAWLAQHAYRQRRYRRQNDTQKERLSFLLQNFNRFCLQQYRHATQALDASELKVTLELASSIQPVRLPDYLNRLGLVLFLEAPVTFMKKTLLKTTTRMLELRDQVRSEQDSIGNYIQFFEANYKVDEKQYYEAMIALGTYRDMLEDYSNGTTVIKGAEAEWINSYFSIFEKWRKEGASKEVEISYQKIILEVVELNGRYRQVPFVMHTGRHAAQCMAAYASMKRNDVALREKLGQFAYYHRLACRVTTAMLRRMTPALATPMHATTTPAMENPQVLPPVPERRRRLVPALLLACALAGLFFLISYKALHHSVSKPTATKTTVANIVPSPEPENVTASNKNLTYGIDISKYQGDLIEELDNLDTLQFLICKATEGKRYTDPDFRSYWAFIRERKLVRGAYHFFHVEEDPVKQARHFAATVGKWDSTDIPPVADIEDGSITAATSNAFLQQQLLAFLKEVERLTGRKPMIYTNFYFADEHLNDPQFASYALWLADYRKGIDPQLPLAWKGTGYRFWQKTDAYSIASEKADFDIFNGGDSALTQFIRQY